jgi:hypothetical protein
MPVSDPTLPASVPSGSSKQLERTDVTDDWFLALDGDDIGRRLELHMVTEDANGLKAFASSFEDALDRLFRRIDALASVGVLLRGGDSLLLTMPEFEIAIVVDLVRSAMDGTGFTFSGGYGPTMRAAYLALKIAKATGKDKIVALDAVEHR